MKKHVKLYEEYFNENEHRGYMANGITYEVTSDALIFRIINREDFEDELESLSSLNINEEKMFIELIEPILYDNGMRLVPPEEVGALTESLIIEYNEEYYWYPNYQISLYLEPLKEDGEIVFTKAEAG